MNTIEARRRLLGRNVYKRTTEGNPAIAQGSLARMYPGIVMQGWTTQDGTPTPETPVPIVSAGTQNQETGKWEYEITIANAQTDATKNQTVTLTSDRPLTKWDRLEKRNGVWGWVYKSGSYTVTGEEDYVSSIQYIGERTCDAYFMNPELTDTVSNRNDGYCNSLERHPALWLDNSGIVGFSYNGHQTHIRISNSETGATKEDPPSDVAQKIKAYAAQKYEEGNPFIFWYETAEETFVPLSESEQEAMNALYTFRPTTVLSNDCECNMALTYKTKKSLEVTD